MTTILPVDAEPQRRPLVYLGGDDVLSAHLRSFCGANGYGFTAHAGDANWDAILEPTYQVVLVDLDLPSSLVVDFLRHAGGFDSQTPVIVVGKQHEISGATLFRAFTAGAFGFLAKNPLKIERLKQVLHHAFAPLDAWLHTLDSHGVNLLNPAPNASQRRCD